MSILITNNNKIFTYSAKHLRSNPGPNDWTAKDLSVSSIRKTWMCGHSKIIKPSDGMFTKARYV